MRLQSFTIAVALSGLILFGSHLTVNAQQPMAANGITMAVYPVERGTDGVQYIITHSGAKVAVPGLGIAPDANQIFVYRDQENHFWYVNRSGETTPVSLQQLQWVYSQVRAQTGGMPPAEMPPYQGQAAQPAPQQNVTVNQQAPATGSGSGALGTGVAAAGGAMLGSMVGSSIYNSNPSYMGGYHGVPYGTPMSMEGGKYYYNNSSGNKVYVAPTTNNTAAFDQWNKQGASGYYHPQTTPTPAGYPETGQAHPEYGQMQNRFQQSSPSAYHAQESQMSKGEAEQPHQQYGQMQNRFEQSSQMQGREGRGEQAASQERPDSNGGRFGRRSRTEEGSGGRFRRR